MEFSNGVVTLKTIMDEDLEPLWTVAYKNHTLWMQYDAPYFNEQKPSREAFLHDEGPKRYVNNDKRLAIWFQGRLIGTVNAYFEDGALKKWLEVGILIFDESLWGKNIGTQALSLWIDAMFKLYPAIQRVGFTTWSANIGMMRLGEKLGMKQEARIRQVRFYQGKYYDQVKYGILKDEWHQ